MNAIAHSSLMLLLSFESFLSWNIFFSKKSGIIKDDIPQIERSDRYIN